jgi:hypothetical protein
MSVYTRRLFTVHGLSTNVSFQVPAGRQWVIRSFNAVYEGTVFAAAVYLQVPGGALALYNRWNSAADELFWGWTGYLGLDAGDTAVVGTGGAGMDVTITGYDFASS